MRVDRSTYGNYKQIGYRGQEDSTVIIGFFYVSPESISNMVKTVVREHHWSPDIINGLYLDDIDRFGLEYWYNDIIECVKEIKKKN